MNRVGRKLIDWCHYLDLMLYVGGLLGNNAISERSTVTPAVIKPKQWMEKVEWEMVTSYL